MGGKLLLKIAIKITCPYLLKPQYILKTINANIPRKSVLDKFENKQKWG